MALNAKHRMIKLLGKKKSLRLGLGRVHRFDIKNLAHKGKIDKLDLIKTKNFYSAKGPIR